MMIHVTLIIPLEENRILLGMKKRGFGKDFWNGFGGKVHEGETVRQAAVRELYEECYLRVHEQDLIEMGTMHFTFEIKHENDMCVHLFVIESFSGTPQETEEMRPQWFTLDAVPYDNMWDGDIHFFPYLLNRQRVEGKMLFADDGRFLRVELTSPETKVITASST